MENSPARGDKREFLCLRCQGRIRITRDLPASTAPCPYCGEMITSPPPAEEVPWPDPAPVAEPTAEPRPASSPVPELSPPTKPPWTPQKIHKATATPEDTKPTALKDWLPVAAFFILLVIGGGTALVLGVREIRKPKTPPVEQVEPIDELIIRENHYIRTGWRKDAERVLAGFIAGSSVRDKLPFILDGELLSERLEEFYGDSVIDDSDTPAESFAVRKLSEEDRRRGIFMMTFDQPPQIDMREFFRPLAPLEVQYGLEEVDLLLSSAAISRNFAMEPLRVHAFFKRTADGLKLEWEIFAQTKYQKFRNFLESPGEGRARVFRVMVMQDVPDDARRQAGRQVYRLADPAHRTHSARVAVEPDSEIGRILSELDWLGKPDAQPRARTATVELAWTGEAGSRTLELRRFICWEFLDLGGIDSGPPANPE